MSRVSNTYPPLKKMRIIFIAFAFILWGIASYLFAFTKTVYVGYEGSHLALIAPYWVESVFLFVGGIVVIVLSLTHGAATINIKGKCLTAFGTSLLALGIFFIFGFTIENIGNFGNPGSFFVFTLFIIIGILISAYSVIVISHGLRNQP